MYPEQSVKQLHSYTYIFQRDKHMSHSPEPDADIWEKRSDEAQSDELGDRDIIDSEDLFPGGKTIGFVMGASAKHCLKRALENSF